MSKINEIQNLKLNANKLRSILPKYAKERENSSCDKYACSFGGDDRFSVFKTCVFLDCHTGYYGDSSCGTLVTVDNAMATRALNAALNKHKALILDSMAEALESEAQKLIGDAEAELKKIQDLLDSVRGVKAVEQ
jgi:hypothetical protein